ncbi:hypothetical protein ACH4ZX_28145 [Streptomyces sp. NPDC020490]|uniref:hypothetical protein n=1 Tax=Streptomyces sp. NPDC020490 TaxID=3365078 RepID=UPI0037AAEE85
MERLYKRGSRSCGPQDIEPDTRAAIAAHAEERSLGDVLANAVACCDTVSTRLYKTGLFSRLKGMSDPDPEHRTVALFTPRHLVVAVTRASTGTTVMSARLDGMSLSGRNAVADRFPGHGSALEDSGISINAHWSRHPEYGAYYVALGDDDAGRDFLDALRKAVAAAQQS